MDNTIKDAIYVLNYYNLNYYTAINNTFLYLKGLQLIVVTLHWGDSKTYAKDDRRANLLNSLSKVFEFG